MARKFNGRPTFLASLSASIHQTLMASSAAADRIMAGNAQPGDAALLRAGERSIEFLMGKVVS